ncbi:MAG: YggS family pyridoxal phosphate-dependent enzyme [Pyrinomonadaceae bacterium]|nr:YggS family pyridoxal phosphate-dependent enzyme [Phycisphaerales bacterium]
MTADGRTMRERYDEVRSRMLTAAKKAGTDPKAVVLVAVTKNAEPEQIRELIQLGHADYGENRVQQLLQRAAMIDEWLARHRTLPGAPWSVGNQLDLFSDGKPKSTAPAPASSIRWHMIGTLQRNKVKKVADICHLIHSVDSLRLAEEIQAISVKRETPIDVLLQVNTSGEASKCGCAPAAAIHLAEQIDTMLNVRLRGVMTIAKYSRNPDDARLTFARARDIYHDIQDAGFSEGHCNILSMGMSGDYEVAIEEGSSMIRVGTAIFGEPPPGVVDSDAPESEEPEGADDAAKESSDSDMD